MAAQSCNISHDNIDRDKIAAMVKKASSSFYWAMRILSKPKRDAMFAVYAFCRAVDDVADGNIEYSVKQTALKRWRDEVDALYGGMPKFSIIQALKKPVADFGLRQEDFIAVIDGMQMDADGPVVAPSAQELDVYCDRVASAVGRLCVCIFGEPGENGMQLAYHQGRALQLTNILRDVDEDAGDGRLYLPRELLEKHGVPFDDPMKVMDYPGFVKVWREVAEQASEHYLETRKALEKCKRHNVRASIIMMEVYERNLKRMMALDDAVIADRNVSKRLVGKFEKLVIALRYALV